MGEENKEVDLQNQALRIAALEKQMAAMIDRYNYIATKWDYVWLKLNGTTNDFAGKTK